MDLAAQLLDMGVTLHATKTLQTTERLGTPGVSQPCLASQLGNHHLAPFCDLDALLMQV